MSAGESVLNFGDLDDLGFDPSIAYNGGVNSVDYSGSSTFDDVTLGSDTLGLSGDNTTASVYDGWDNPSPYDSLSLSGVSDPPFQSSYQSTPYPNSQPTSDSTWSAISALSKVGASLAGLLIPHPTTQAVGTQRGTVTGSQQPQITNTNTLILVIVFAAVLIILLTNGGE